MKWLDGIPLWLIALVAVYMLLAPFVPEPHLWQKLKMLLAGELVRPIDIFDLFWHIVPIVVLGLKLARMRRLKRG